MHAGTRPDGTDAFAEPLFDEHHWDLRVVIAVTVEGEKEVASTDGMNLTERTSPYYPAWIETVEPDVQSAMTAIAARDFDHLARIAEASALRMHASAIAADPGVLYWRGATVEVIHEVRRLRAGGLPVFFTIDAGPHVKVFTPSCEVAAVVRALDATPGVLRTIVTAPAAGAARL
jgi:diphosphomevalonate decarboxylase